MDTGEWRVLKDWNKPKPEPEPAEPPPVMDEMRMHVEKMRAQQQMYEMQAMQAMQAMQNMQGMNPYQQGFAQQALNMQNGLGNALSQLGAYQQSMPPQYNTLHGLKSDTLTAKYSVAGLMALQMPPDRLQEYVRRELAMRLTDEIMRKIAVTEDRGTRVNRDDVVFTATIYIAYEGRK